MPNLTLSWTLTVITIHDVIQGSPEWHELRDGLYTGQNIHKLLKTNDKSYALTHTTSFSGNFATDRGHILEDEAIELYEAIKGVKVDRPGFVTNDKYPNCGYSFDGLCPDRSIEVKAFNEVRHLANARELEMEIKAQVQFGQIIGEKNLTDVLLYNPDIEADKALIIITVKKNPSIHKNIKTRLP